MRIGKKGDMHLEMILSFVIFTGFTIFLLAVFNPIKINKSSNDLEIAKREILKDATTEVDFLTIKLTNAPVAGDCFSFDYDDINNNKKAIVNKPDNSRVNAKKSGKKISIMPNDNTQTYFIKAEKEDFSENGNVCSNNSLQPTTGYIVGASISYNMTSLKKIESLKSRYDLDYNQLKEDIGISMNFGFEVVDENIKAEKQIQQGKNVIANTIPIQIVYADGIKYRKLIIKVW